MTVDLVATDRRLAELKDEQKSLTLLREQQEKDLAVKLCPFTKDQRVPIAPDTLLEVSRVTINLDDPQHPSWTLDGYRRNYGPVKSQGAPGIRDWLHQADHEALPEAVRAQTHESLAEKHAPRVNLDGPLRLTDSMRSLLGHAVAFFQNHPGQPYAVYGVSMGPPISTKKAWMGLLQQGVVKLSAEAESRGVSQDSAVHRWSIGPAMRYTDALTLLDLPRVKPGKPRPPSA